MKRMSILTLIGLLMLILTAGCSTLGGSKKSGTGEAPKKRTDKGLYAQVPAAAKADVKEAEFDLKQAQSKLKQADEIKKLADMKKERAELGVKYAKLGVDIAQNELKASEMEVEIREWEAIDDSGLGDKEKNINKIADLKSDKLKLESKIVKTRADYATTGVKMKKLDKEIRAQQAKSQTK